MIGKEKFNDTRSATEWGDQRKPNIAKIVAVEHLRECHVHCFTKVS